MENVAARPNFCGVDFDLIFVGPEAGKCRARISHSERDASADVTREN